MRDGHPAGVYTRANYDPPPRRLRGKGLPACLPVRSRFTAQTGEPDARHAEWLVRVLRGNKIS